MSYNIDTFKLKQMEDLVIPVASFYKHERTDWHPVKKIGQEDDSFMRIESAELVYVEGPVMDGNIHVKHIDWHGEFSGTAMDWILEPALKDSAGMLVASCVWEGGDTINQLQVNDGKVEWVDIEI